MLARTVTVLVSALLVGCGSTDPEPRPPRDESPTTPADTTPATTPPSDLVGERERRTSCEQRVRALGDAGLGRFAAEHAAGEGWIPGVTSVDQLEDPRRPCRGAVPLRHSHFFTADGSFGSRDAQGDQVDDGTYTLLDERTIVVSKEFGDVTFGFKIRDERLFLTPVLPDCAENGCFAAQWAVAVAYPGLPWQRRQ